MTFPHRQGLLADVSALRPDPALLDRIGGPEVIARIVDRLYDHGVLRDPHLAMMFTPQLDRKRAGDFFVQWLGGPPYFSDDPRHGRGLWRSHKRFYITKAMVGRWLGHMKNALDGCGVDADTRAEFMRALVPLAHGLIDMPAGDTEKPERWPADAELEFHGKTYQTKLFFAVEAARELAAQGDCDALRTALTDEPRIAVFRGSHGRTVLWTAAAAGQLDAVDLLLEQSGIEAMLDAPGCGPMPIDFTAPIRLSPDGYRAPLLMVAPVAVAHGNGHASIVERLLARGARRDVFTAAYMGELSMVQSLCASTPALITHADSADDFHVMTALHHAVAGGRLSVVRWLIDNGAEVAPHSRWLTTLAALGEQSEILELLLNSGARADASVSLGPLEGETYPIAEMLVAAGASLERNPLHGNLLLHVCRRVLFSEDPVSVQLASLRTLLALGADVNARGQHDDTPLHAAARSGSIELVELFLAHGADVKARNDEGHTPLVSVRSSPIAIDPLPRLQALVDHGADINAQNLLGESLLLHYVRTSQRAVVAWLLASGADPDLANHEGETPRSLAGPDGIR